jgi:hypothetical protein
MNIKTIAKRGVDGMECWCLGDPKYCGTAIAIVDAAGEKKSLWIIAKGLTNRWEHQHFFIHHREVFQEFRCYSEFRTRAFIVRVIIDD